MSTFVPSSILGNLSCLARELLGACCWLRVVSIHGAVTLTEALKFLSSQQMEVCHLHGWKIPQCDFSHFKWNCLSSFPRGGQAWKESWRLSSSHELCYTQTTFSSSAVWRQDSACALHRYFSGWRQTAILMHVSAVADKHRVSFLLSRGWRDDLAVKRTGSLHGS